MSRRRLSTLLVSLLAVVIALAMTPPSASSAHDAGFRALLFTKTAAGAYRHDSIPAGVSMFQQMATDHNFTLVHSENSTVFNDTDLATFDVVIMFQTSGMVWDTDAQRAAMQNYVSSGGGVVAIHNATDMNIEGQFPWWDNLVNAGAHMSAHAATLPGTIKVADQDHPSVAGLPDRWQRTEEWYNFTSNPRGDVHVLVTADETTYDAGSEAMGHDHPLSWCRLAEGARVWTTGMGHAASSYSEPLFQQHILGGVEWAAGSVEGECSGTVWDRYQKVTLDSAPNQPMQLDIAPDRRVYYVSRTGAVRTIHPTTGEVTTAATLNVYSGGEDGLVGIALDPNFATNRHMFLYYSPAGTAEINRVSRFTVTASNTVDLASEEILLSIPAYRGSDEPGHTGGGLDFGPGGNLYISVGDDVNPGASDGFTPIDERPGRQKFDAQGSSANTNDLRGKILRIHPEADGTYTIPAGNMFPPGTASTRPEIYGMGFRNAFRFSVDPVTGWISLADYGPDSGQANANRGPEGTVEWNLVKEPGNYGWPYCIGNNTPFNDYNFATGQSGAKFNCAAPVNNSPNNTGLTNLPAAKPATVWYTYSQTPEFPEMGTGSAAPMGGPFYHYDENNPSTTKFPKYFDNTPFFYEWGRNFLMEMRLDDNGNLLKLNKVLSNLSLKSPMDMKFGPDGSMYLIEWGTGFGGSNTDDGVYRIDFVAGSRAPVAKLTATPTSGQAPLAVAFSAAGSSDPDGDPISYAWDFDGNGTTDATSATANHTYTANGTYAAKLTVTDSDGKQGTDTVTITVGNSAPVVQFTNPPNGGLFQWGDQIRYTIDVTDQEDGAIDCSKVTVIAAVGHDTHSHDVGQHTGCSGVVQTANDHGEYANTFFVLTASYTDAGGLTDTTSAVLLSKHGQAEYFSNSSGVRVVSDAGAENGNRIGDISNNDWISFSPMSLKGINSVAYRVSSPYGGGTIELRADSPTGQLLSSTSVPNTGGWNNYQLLPAQPVSALSGTHELFMVFKHSQNNQFDVDSFTFGGPGAGRPTPTHGTVYTLSSLYNGLFVDVNGYSTANEAQIIQWTGTGGLNQQWRAVDGGNGTYNLVSVLSNLCLDVAGADMTSGAKLIQYTCGSGANQKWRFELTSDDDWQLVSVNSGLCLDVPGWSSTTGVQLQQWTCSSQSNQRWKATPVA